MNVTKAYVLWFDGYNGVVVDYLDNQIDFHAGQVPPSILPYLVPNASVVVEDTEEGLFITTPEDSFHSWVEDQQEENVYDLDESDADTSLSEFGIVRNG